MELPIYQCHKKVGAAKITAMSDPDVSGDIALTLGDLGGLVVSLEWRTRNPKLAVGGYFVKYIENEDQYTAYSPADAFENGYVLA